MNEKDLKIQQLTRKVAKWKKRALEAAIRACNECDEYVLKREEECRKCSIRKIREEAGKG